MDRVLELKEGTDRSSGGRVRARAAATMGSFEDGGEYASFEPGGSDGGVRRRRG